MAEGSLWTVTTEGGEQSLPAGDECAGVIRSAAEAGWGWVSVERGAAGRLVLRFEAEFGFLEYWASEDGPVSGARCPNRGPVTERPVEVPGCGCGIPLQVPDGYAFRKKDAVRLLLQFVAGGVLPGESAEPRGVAQPVLPGLEEFVIPPSVINAVQWEPL